MSETHFIRFPSFRRLEYRWRHFLFLFATGHLEIIQGQFRPQSNEILVHRPLMLATSVRCFAGSDSDGSLVFTGTSTAPSNSSTK